MKITAYRILWHPDARAELAAVRPDLARAIWNDVTDKLGDDPASECGGRKLRWRVLAMDLVWVLETAGGYEVSYDVVESTRVVFVQMVELAAGP